MRLEVQIFAGINKTLVNQSTVEALDNNWQSLKHEQCLIRIVRCISETSTQPKKAKVEEW